MKNLFIPLFISVLVFSCKNNDDVIEDITPKTLFTYTSDFGNGDGTEEWIILRDSETGDLIDAKQVQKNIPLIFESKVKVSNDKLSITQLTISQHKDFVLAGVYNGIAVGSVWVPGYFEDNRIPAGNSIGSYSIEITGVPDIYNYALGNGQDDISYYLNSNGSTLTGDGVDISANSRKHILSVYPISGDPRYRSFDNLAGGDEIKFSYSEFKAFDKILNVKFPEGNTPQGTIRMLDSGTGFWYSLFSSYGFIEAPEDLTEANFGFLSGYNYYEINLAFGDFQYSSQGPAPTSIDFVDAEQFTVNNNSIDKFSATASHSYNFRAIHYVYDAPDAGIEVDITYYDPAPGAQHFDAFTPELISKYSIPMTDVKFESASFIVGGQTYEQWQNYWFVNANFNDPYFITSVIKNDR
jgi:hypothetical protein